MARSLMIGGLTSQSNNIRDERDRSLQIVRGDHPNNNNPNTLRTRRELPQAKQYRDRNGNRQYSGPNDIKSPALKMTAGWGAWL